MSLVPLTILTLQGCEFHRASLVPSRERVVTPIPAWIQAATAPATAPLMLTLGCPPVLQHSITGSFKALETGLDTSFSLEAAPMGWTQDTGSRSGMFAAGVGCLVRMTLSLAEAQVHLGCHHVPDVVVCLLFLGVQCW